MEWRKSDGFLRERIKNLKVDFRSSKGRRDGAVDMDTKETSWIDSSRNKIRVYWTQSGPEYQSDLDTCDETIMLYIIYLYA